MILFFDTETTGLPISYNEPLTNFDNWPRLVQLAYILQDMDGNTILEGNYLIKPFKFEIPKTSEKIHGISNEEAIKNGVELTSVLNEFNVILENVKYLIGFNINFDIKILAAEFLSNNIENNLLEKNVICVMQESTDFCKIKGEYGYKWPKLSELHKKLFNTEFDNAHDALVDIKTTIKCFWELINREEIRFERENNFINDTEKNEFVQNEIANNEYFDSKKLMDEIIVFCKSNNIKKVPLYSIFYSIMYFEFKCKNLPENSHIDDEFIFLSKYWKRDKNRILNQELNVYQSEFIRLIKNEVLNDNNFENFFKSYSHKTDDEKIKLLATLTISNNIEDKIHRDLSIKYYYYFLARYLEFLPDEIKPKIFEKEIDISTYNTNVQKAYKNIKNLFDDFCKKSETIKNFETPDLIYKYLCDNLIELETIKKEVGNKDSLYLNEFNELIKFTVNCIIALINDYKNFVFLEIENLKLGKTMWDSYFESIILIDKLEKNKYLDDWFKQKSKEILDLKYNNPDVIYKKEGCYIATMAYNDYNHPQVLLLRNFRDKHLLNSKIGYLIVDFYYWFSPKIVNLCNNNIFINKISKRLLDFFIKHFIVK
jgi:DNA polymerase-3 subunit epsilon